MFNSTKKRVFVLFTAIALIGILAAASAQEENGAAVGEPAPGFTLTCWGGNPHSLSDFEGKIVVLEWTNPHCPFVVRVYRDGLIPALQKEFTEKDVVWLVINSTNPEHSNYEKPETLQEIYADWESGQSHFLMDPEGKVGKMYDAKTTPHIFIIGADGKLAYSGALDDDPRGAKDTNERTQYVRLALEALKNGGKIEAATTQPYGCSVKYR